MARGPWRVRIVDEPMTWRERVSEGARRALQLEDAETRKHNFRFVCHCLPTALWIFPYAAVQYPRATATAQCSETDDSYAESRLELSTATPSLAKTLVLERWPVQGFGHHYRYAHQGKCRLPRYNVPSWPSSYFLYHTYCVEHPDLDRRLPINVYCCEI